MQLRRMQEKKEYLGHDDDDGDDGYHHDNDIRMHSSDFDCLQVIISSSIMKVLSSSSECL